MDDEQVESLDESLDEAFETFGDLIAMVIGCDDPSNLFEHQEARFVAERGRIVESAGKHYACDGILPHHVRMRFMVMEVMRQCLEILEAANERDGIDFKTHSEPPDGATQDASG